MLTLSVNLGCAVDGDDGTDLDHGDDNGDNDDDRPQ